MNRICNFACIYSLTADTICTQSILDMSFFPSPGPFPCLPDSVSLLCFCKITRSFTWLVSVQLYTIWKWHHYFLIWAWLFSYLPFVFLSTFLFFGINLNGYLSAGLSMRIGVSIIEGKTAYPSPLLNPHPHAP